jgi:uncharacterized membrane protein YeaQ/YmgE (transglycosylase-associated protein family)
MGFIAAIIIGGIAGYIAEKAMDSRMGLLANIGLGILGGLIGTWLAGVVGIAFYGWLGRLIIATAGACLLIWLARLVRARRA